MASAVSPTGAPQIDQFLLLHSARSDTWRDLTQQAADWAAGKGTRGQVEARLAAMELTEAFHAFPGPHLLAYLRERVAGGDAAGAAQLVRRLSNALLTHAYRDSAEEWDVHLSLIHI